MNKSSAEPLWRPYPESFDPVAANEIRLAVTLPDQHHVVMGASGKAEREVYADRLAEYSIPLYKRKGGGGTVLLGPETIIITVHAHAVHPFHNLAYFSAVNRALITVFRTWRKLDYGERGISDIAVGPKKILGSSIYRRRDLLLYQASLLVHLNIDLVEKTLRHPPKEPDYRAGRDHRDFMTCLADLGIPRPKAQLADDLREQLPPLLQQEIGNVNGNP
ncbi:lipoate--protein ligase family protein [Acanthopleuribacter pedis]|uniref:BPL/LPL catalytic domain-containing protein n=1 Tax=Acanthopleuribacter pedis TaxID=442870 RepID=A0A8J7QB23_9BACT|nr:hypothetical protein [Acanthopleuribacter pedis]MBO1321162.1 hypothetical protein [Acanthopleuribacter pedis]